MEKPIETIFDKISSLFTDFVNNHNKSMYGNKAAGNRARNILRDIKKIIPIYREASIEMGKKS